MKALMYSVANASETIVGWYFPDGNGAHKFKKCILFNDIYYHFIYILIH